MSRFLQAIEPEKIAAVIGRMRRAGWQQPVINLADENGCDLSLNEEGSRYFRQALVLYHEARQAALAQDYGFDQAAARAAIFPWVQMIERALTPPEFTADEREVLMELVLLFVMNEKNGSAELTLQPITKAS